MVFYWLEVVVLEFPVRASGWLDGKPLFEEPSKGNEVETTNTLQGFKHFGIDKL